MADLANMITDLGRKFNASTEDLSTRIGELEKRAARSSGYVASNDNADFASEIANHPDLGNFDPNARKMLRLKMERGFTGEEFATITSGSGTVGNNTSGATSLVTAHRVPGITTPAERKLVIRDLFSVFPTINGIVEYVKEESFTNNSRPVTEGETKPDSDLTFELYSAKAVTIAHLFHASVQILADAPTLGNYIAQRALRGLKVTEEAQLLSGDGTGQNLNGVLNQASEFDTALRSGTDTRQIDIVRRAIQQVRNSEHEANGIVVHPDSLADWELTKDDEGRYILGNPVNGNQPKLWGLPVVPSTAISSGEFLVGAFGSAAAIFDRQDAVIELSTEHADNFAKNLVSIRCEERIAMAVFQPSAFVYGDFSDAMVTTGSD